MFIVLRKRKLIFLHWYHHTTVLVITWYAGSTMASSGMFKLFSSRVLAQNPQEQLVL